MFGANDSCSSTDCWGASVPKCVHENGATFEHDQGRIGCAEHVGQRRVHLLVNDEVGERPSTPVFFAVIVNAHGPFAVHFPTAVLETTMGPVCVVAGVALGSTGILAQAC